MEMKFIIFCDLLCHKTVIRSLHADFQEDLTRMNDWKFVAHAAEDGRIHGLEEHLLGTTERAAGSRLSSGAGNG